MTQDTNTASGAAIKRYKIGYHTDEWGVRSSTPGGITDPSGQWVLYKDHLAALASHGQTPARADMQDAYVGAREDLAIWKRRALEAERDLRAERETASRLAAEINAINGPTHLGEPAPTVQPAPAQAASAHKDSTPELHAGDSAFESWYSTYNPAHKSDKQRARDAYAAGMGDPLVMAAPAAVAGTSAPTSILKRATELHEKGFMPWAEAEELALSEAGIDDAEIDELIGNCGYAGLSSLLTTEDELRTFTRSVLVHQPHIAPTTQQEAAYTSVQLAELVLSDCGHSSNYTPLLDRVAARIDAHVERRLDELRGCLEYKPAPKLEATRVDPKTMGLAESVGLIGPASRTHDLHAAIQRFHDLICANATIKAAQMAAEVISKAAPQQEAAEDVDGHAFRTAARLGLTLRFYGGCAQSGMPGSPSAYEVCADRDRAAAMREAVARAEAVISRGGEAQRLEAPQPSPASQEDALDAARYRLVRRGQRWSVIDGIGNDLRAEALDAAIDAARAAQEGKK